MRKRNTSGPQRNRKDSTGSSDNRKRSSASYKKSTTGSRKRSDDDSSDERKRPSAFRSNGPAKRSSRTSSRTESTSRFSKGRNENKSESRGRSEKRDDSSAGKRPYKKRSDDSRSGGRDEKPFSGKRSFADDKGKRPYKSRSTDSAKPFERKDTRSTSGRFAKPKRDERFDKKPRFGKKTDEPRDTARPTSRKKEDSSSRFAKPKSDAPYERKSRFTKGRDEARPARKPDERDERESGAPRSEPRKRIAGGTQKGKSLGPKIKGDSDDTASGKIRLNKYISNSGVCSRREADELIKMGLISVNGKAITELGYKVNPGDEVRHESTVLKAEKPVYILMNKPKGFITTTNDPQERNTVMHIIGGAVKERIYPVGRLDRNTTGLLLLTNDGDLADKLMHPSYKAKKIYKAELDRPLTKGDFKKIQEGVQLEEGVALVDDVAIVSEDGKTVGVELHIGWNRVVRRIFETLEYEVIKLDRSVYAGLDKKDLPRGHWRFLKKEEIVHLKHYK